MQFLKWVRKKKLSVSAISKETGIARQTINNALSGNIDMTLKTAVAIVRFTNGEVTFEDLVRENDKDKKPQKNRKKDHDPLPSDIAI